MTQVVVIPRIECDIRPHILFDLCADEALGAALAEVSSRVHIVVSHRKQRMCRHLGIQCDRKAAGVGIEIAERCRRRMRNAIERIHSIQIEHFVS